MAADVIYDMKAVRVFSSDGLTNPGSLPGILRPVLIGVKIRTLGKQERSMRLNDPFGRLERRHQQGYEAMRKALQDAGIRTRPAAQEVAREAGRRAILLLSVGLLSLLLLAGVLPNAAPLALALAVFLAMWVVASTLNGRRYIRRYIEEELEGSKREG